MIIESNNDMTYVPKCSMKPKFSTNLDKKNSNFNLNIETKFKY